LVLDADGCPRCRNYGEATLEEVFRCLAGLGTTGCGFEQPLEAMYLALDDNPHNAGFLRERAFLGILFVTDEDDCSAADPSLFDTAADSPLGPLTGYRCFEHGITCQPTDDRNVLGPRTDCVPREDPDALLHPISRYVDLLHALKDPQLLMVSAIAGPTHGNTVTVGLDEYEQPMLEPSCTRDDGRADPGIRLAAFVEAFNAPEDLAWAYQSICSDDYSAALAGLGSTVRDHLDVGCLEAPLAGCTDPAVEHGLPGDGQPCNDVCRPQCEVEEIQARGMPSESRVPVPPCLEICQGGPCPGNQDRAQAYRSGHPDPRDPELPVEVCWHVSHQPGCSDSNAAELRLARRFDPPYRTFAQVTCVLLYPEETRCTDGKDNDEDCLIDALDPDCQ
jgi:hypothetical protein